MKLVKLNITEKQLETIKEAIELSYLHNNQTIERWGGQSKVEPIKGFIRDARASNKRMDSLRKRLMA